VRVNVIRTMKDDYIEAARPRGRRALGRLSPRLSKRARSVTPSSSHDRAPTLRRHSDGDDVQLAGLGHTLLLYLQNRD